MIIFSPGALIDVVIWSLYNFDSSVIKNLYFKRWYVNNKKIQNYFKISNCMIYINNIVKLYINLVV